MSTRDHARFALLVHRDSLWDGRRLLDPEWIREMRRPCALNPQYGLLWWLNTGRTPLPSAPESSDAARGAGSNVIWIDPEHDVVAVVRWIDTAAMDGFASHVVAAVEK
jgi:CubicO group peptidase (beta-lactamase class C family)